MSRKCGCADHESNVKDVNEFKIIDIRHKTIAKSTINGLLGKRRVNFLCSCCVRKYENENPTCDNAKRQKKSECANFIEQISTGVFDESELSKISFAIGKQICSSVNQDIHSIENMYNDEDALSSFSPSSWLRDRNQILTNFLKGVVDISALDDSDSRTAAIAASVDCLYKAKCQTLVTPLFFSRNLINYHVSGSKLICNLLAGLSPAGTYTTVLKWLDNHSTTNNQVPVPATDITTYFDNNQVLLRNWRVRCDARVGLSAITSVVHIIPSRPSSLQYDPALSPSSWLYSPNIDLEMVCDRIHAMQIKCDGYFTQLRNSYLKQRISEIYNDQMLINGEIVDFIDGDLPFSSSPDLSQIYESIPCNHNTLNPPKTLLNDPIMVNPCSFRSVESVLHSISSTCCSGDRSWTVVGCDGLPYALASRKIQDIPSLKNIILTPGLGHQEINMTRALFKILWDPMLVDLAKILNYKSKRAIATCKNAYNHHKSWQILCITFFGTCDEIILQYVRSEMENNNVPSLTEFYNFLGAAENPNVSFLKDCILTYLFALIIFRAGVRRNNADAIMAGKMKFAPLFYSLNMLFYQEIHFRDCMARVLMPQEIKEWWTENESFSTSGSPIKGEGGDFVLEAKNKAIKQWLPAGMPDERRWRRSIRNLDRLQKIRENVGIKESISTMKVNIQPEIKAWRVHVRSTRYLTQTKEKKEHISIRGEILDHDLVHFAIKSKENMQMYLEDICHGHKPDDDKEDEDDD
ncbi:hypothetical protein FSP39_019273 [Pinctada imbricata]|uniref:Uncharacterized protein n=1 Tax=Pinctada imbricata TaxID=66713 RepID=A0AA89CB92_PINIB|nr:hypothetical protein FSP39_019273 [Pinctada imbricata]